MNIQRPEHLENQYIYREFGGYIFKLPRNKDLNYQSVELQEYYYWTLTDMAYKHLIAEKHNPSISTQVAGWEITSSLPQNSSHQPSSSRYIQLNDIKKPQRDKLIITALAQVFITNNTPNTNNPFQYVETMT